MLDETRAKNTAGTEGYMVDSMAGAASFSWTLTISKIETKGKYIYTRPTTHNKKPNTEKYKNNPPSPVGTRSFGGYLRETRQ